MDVPSLPILGLRESMASPWRLLPLSVYRQFAYSVVIVVCALAQFIEIYFAVVRELIYGVVCVVNLFSLVSCSWHSLVVYFR